MWVGGWVGVYEVLIVYLFLLLMIEKVRWVSEWVAFNRHPVLYAPSSRRIWNEQLVRDAWQMHHFLSLYEYLLHYQSEGSWHWISCQSAQLSRLLNLQRLTSISDCVCWIQLGMSHFVSNWDSCAFSFQAKELEWRCKSYRKLKWSLLSFSCKWPHRPS